MPSKKDASKPDYDAEFDLKNHPPQAGETRKFATGEAFFLSPLPLPTGQIPVDLGGSFVAVNDVYLDVGSSNLSKSYQARLCVMLPTTLIFLMQVVLPVGMGIAGEIGNPFGRTFWYYFSELFTFGLWISLLGGGAAALIGIWAVVTTTLAKARARPLRFHRQRREVCFFPNGSDEPVICPWEKMVAWVSVSTGQTGVGAVTSYTFGMAVDDPKHDKVHFLLRGALTPLHGLVQWESIRTYMEKGPEFAPGVAPYEGLHTFDKEREDMREEYHYKERSALGVAWWYVSHVFTLWRFPYWVAEWDHGYSMKAMPDSIAVWSQSIPPEEWAKPSPELKEESVKIEAAFAEGINFAKYFESKLVKIE